MGVDQAALSNILEKPKVKTSKYFTEVSEMPWWDWFRSFFSLSWLRTSVVAAEVLPKLSFSIE